MEWLAGKIVEWLIVHETVAKEDRDLYEYAVICLLMAGAPLVLAVFVGGFLGELSTALFIILPFMALRKFSGGYHAKHVETCLICSSGLLVISIMIAARIAYSWQLTMAMFTGAAWMFACSPIDSMDRKLDREEQKRYKYVVGILSFTVCVISVLSKLYGSERFAVCMAIGLFLTLILQIPCVLQKVVKKIKIRISVFIIALLCFSVCTQTIAKAQEKELPSANEIVVLLDCSQSMKSVDAFYASFDFAKSLSAVLPRDYRIGMAAYQKEVCVTQPLGSSHGTIERALGEIEYADYGNAGAGLVAAEGLFDNSAAMKKIILISDGEIMMHTEEETQESVDLFTKAIEEARRNDIIIDVVALGPRMEDGYTVYSAAGATGGKLYELADEEELGALAESLFFEHGDIKASQVGQISGLNGELSVNLPDCLMSKAKLVLLGSQQNDNMTLNCEADRINVSKGTDYTVIELSNPSSNEVKIQMSADSSMDVKAYLIAEYDYNLSAAYTYIQEEQTAYFRLEITNHNGQDMLTGHLKDGGVQVYLDGERQTGRIADGAYCISRQYEHDAAADFRIAFDGLYGNYYGDPEEAVEIVVPVIIEEEPPKIDWFFWSVITIFIAALVIILCLAYRQRKRTASRRKFIDESRILPGESINRKSEFNGKLQIYVIHSKEELDYPPESINLFARCNREMLTLEWLLDACNLPLHLRGAERIIIKPGDDRSLIIKNNSKASVLMGRELLMKGHAYHLYYGEKVTFIFDQEDTEIEVHYRDLKPNER